MAKKVLGMTTPFPGWLNISQSRKSPRAPMDTFPVPIPPSGNARIFASAENSRILFEALIHVSMKSSDDSFSSMPELRRSPPEMVAQYRLNDRSHDGDGS